MLYKKSRDVPTGTTMQSPDWQKLKITQGTIRGWLLFMPVEAANLLHIQVRYHGHQILPINENESLYGGGYFFNIAENVEINDAPFELDIFAWNSDTTYTHEYNLHVNILREEAAMPGEEMATLWERLKGWVGVG